MSFGGDYRTWMLSLPALGKEWIGTVLSSNQIFLKHPQGLFCNSVNILKASLDLTRACLQLWFHYVLKQMSSLSPFSPLSPQVFTLVQCIMSNWFRGPWAQGIHQETEHLSPAMLAGLAFSPALASHQCKKSLGGATRLKRNQTNRNFPSEP